MKGDEIEINKAYNNMGGTYYKKRSEGSLSNTYIANPAIRKILSNVKGLKLLDIGCGFGEDLKYFSKKGADVIGIELNQRLIRIAKKDPELKGIPISQGTIYSLNFKEEFDICLSNLVLDQVKDLKKSFKEVYKTLKPKGRFIFSVAHPFNCATENYHKEIPDYFRVKKGYFKPHSMKQKIPYYFRNFEKYSTAIYGAGFLIKRILEPKPIKEAKKDFGKKYKKMRRVPDILIMELVK